jgi:competence protein ComEC
MKIIHRPVIPVTVLMAIGIAIGNSFSVAFFISISLLAGLLITSFILYQTDRKQLALFAFIFSFLITGIILIQYRENCAENHLLKIEQGSYKRVRGKVISPPTERNNGGMMILEMQRLDGDWTVMENKYKVRIYYNTREHSLESRIRYGDIISFGALAYPVSKPTNPWEFDNREYLKRSGLSASFHLLHPDKILVLNNEGSFLWKNIFAIREKIINNIKLILPEPDSGLLIGILLGERKELPPDLEEAFKNIGTLHIMAASGLHVTLLAGTFLLIMNFLILHIPKFGEILSRIKIDINRIKYLLAIPVIIFYALIAGINPPIVRAAIMGILYLIAASMRKKPDIFNTLFTAALLMIVIDPYTIFTISFQLSFTAVLGIGLIADPLIRKFPERKNIYDRLKTRLPWKLPEMITGIITSIIFVAAVSAAAQISLMPLLAYYFNHLTFISILANIIMVPLANLCLAFGFLGGLLGVAVPFLGNFFLYCSVIPVKLSVGAAYFLNGFSWAYTTIPSPSAVFFILYYSFLLIMTVDILKSSRFRLQAASILMLVAFLLILNRADNLDKMRRLVVFDTGSYSTVLIERKAGNILWIHYPKSGKRSRNNLRWRVLPYLKKRGILQLEALVVTGRKDHRLHELDDLLEEVRVNNIFISPTLADSASFEALNTFEINNTDVNIIDREYLISFRDNSSLVITTTDTKNDCVVKYNWYQGEVILSDMSSQSDFQLNNLSACFDTTKFLLITGINESSKEKINEFFTPDNNNTVINLDKPVSDLNVLSPSTEGAIIFDLSADPPKRVLWK